jgi:hypothetical protein
MTFTPSVLTKDDSNNSNSSVTSSGYTGAATNTTGYNSIIVTIEPGTTGGTLETQFSTTTTDANFETYYLDTLFDNSKFIKSYPILKTYYRIKYTTSDTSTKILSRISTQAFNSTQNSISVFNNAEENIYDAFGKLRVSNPQTLIDLKVPGQDASGLGKTGATGYLQNNLQLVWGYTGTTSAGNTGYITANNSQVDFFLNGQTGNTGNIISQSRKYAIYQPGKSLLFMATGIMDARKVLLGTTGGNTGNTDGMTSRIGYFDDYNGLYFEYKANGTGTGSCSVNIKSNGGEPTTILQNDWNIDKMNGTGPSGLKLDWTKAQLFVMDMEWLGVGRVRFGFYAYGKIQYCHEELNINQISLGPYTYNINLPIRYQFLSPSNNTGCTGAMIQICSTVISEGGYTPVGRSFTYGNTAGITATSSETPLLAIRGGGNNYYHQQILPNNISIASSGTNDILCYYIRLYLPNNTNYGGTGWTNVNSNYSVTQGTTGFNNFTTTDSILLDQNIVLGRGGVTYTNLSDVFNTLLQITSDINNISSIIVLSFSRISGSGTSSIYGTISWQEIY